MTSAYSCGRCGDPSMTSFCPTCQRALQTQAAAIHESRVLSGHVSAFTDGDLSKQDHERSKANNRHRVRR